MILSMSRRELAMLGASALVIAAVATGSAEAQTAQPSSQATNDSAGSAGSTVKEVVVTGQRASLRSAQQIKKNADQIVDSITATDIGALPDRSVTESLQRIVGVTISRTPDPRDADRISVEGAGVQIRGLSWVRSELNGRDSFSAKNGRALNFDDVPSELMAGVDVYKDPSAEIVEGGVGGTVNLRTRLPFDQPGRMFAFSADANYGDLVDKWTPSGSVLASDRWHTPIGELGLLVDFSDSNFSSRTDTISVDPYYARTDLVPGQTMFVPGGFGYRSLLFNRERQGIAAAGQWRPNDQFLVTAQFIRSAAYSTESEHAFGDDPSANLFPSTAAGAAPFEYVNNRFVYGSITDSNGGSTVNPDVLDDRFNTTHSVTSDYSLNLKWTPDSKWSFSADVQYINASSKADDFTLFDSLTSGIPSPTLDLRGSTPSVTFSNDPATAAQLANKANYYWDAAMDFHDHNTADEWAERLDGSYTFGGDWLKSIRFGVRHTDRNAETRETPFHWGYVSQSWTGGGEALLNGTNNTYPTATNAIPSEVYGFSNFFRGSIKIPGLYAGTPSFMQNYAAASAAIWQAENQAANTAANPFAGGWWYPFNGNYNQFTAGGGGGGTNIQSEETWSGYSMLRFGHDVDFLGFNSPMDGNIGLRVVSTEATGKGTVVFPSITNTSFPASDQAFGNNAQSASSGERSYINVLPSLNLRFKLQDDLFLRFAASKSIVRPDFTQMQPTMSVSATSGILSGSNCIQQPNTNTQPNCVYQYTAYAGNPTLKPIRANNYDVTLEWYFAKVGSLTADLFYKDVYNFISTGTRYASMTNNGVTENVLLTSPVNEGHGIVKGFELGYQQYFDFLPGPLRGVGMQANYTYVDSVGARNASADPYDATQIQNSKSPGLPLEGLSRTSYNLTGLYDLGPWSARVAWNWREKYLLTTSAANINIPAWAGNYGQLDASVFYSLTQNLKVGVEAANLTDSRYQVLVSYPVVVNNPGMTGHNWVDADRRFSLVLRGQF